MPWHHRVTDPKLGTFNVCVHQPLADNEPPTRAVTYRAKNGRIRTLKAGIMWTPVEACGARPVAGSQELSEREAAQFRIPRNSPPDLIQAAAKGTVAQAKSRRQHKKRRLASGRS